MYVCVLFCIDQCGYFKTMFHGSENTKGKTSGARTQFYIPPYYKITKYLYFFINDKFLTDC